MRFTLKRTIQLLQNLGASVEELKRSECAYYFSRWTSVYCRQVKLEKGTPCFRGFHWHAFSYELDPCISGEAAMEQYRLEKKSRLLIIPEEWNKGSGLRIEGINVPDLSGLRRDLYVFPESVSWTMVFTHEQPHFGPYYSRRKWCGEEQGGVDVA